MNKIQDMNIGEYYRAELDSAKSDYYFEARSLRELLIDIKTEYNPVSFKEQLLAINQLYFEGTLQNPNDLNAQSQTFEKLFLAGKSAIGSFYEGNGIDFDKIKEMVLPYADKIINYGNTTGFANKRRDLRRCEKHTLNFGLELQKTFDDTKPIDTLVCIASGAFEPSFLAMHIKEKDELTVVRYSHRNYSDYDIRIPKSFPKEYLNSKIKDKKVLIAEDHIASGETVKKVTSFISSLNPDELYCMSALGCCFNLESDNRFEILKEGRPLICRYEPQCD